MIAYVSMLPFFGCFNLIVIGGVATFALVLAFKSGKWKAAWLAVSSVVFISVLWWASVFLFTGVKHQVAHDMTWSYGPNEQGRPGDEHIILRYKKDPRQHVGIISKDLAQYLESRHSPDVRVIFEITTDFGRMRGYRVIQIGERRAWLETGMRYGGATYFGMGDRGAELP